MLESKTDLESNVRKVTKVVEGRIKIAVHWFKRFSYDCGKCSSIVFVVSFNLTYDETSLKTLKTFPSNLTLGTGFELAPTLLLICVFAFIYIYIRHLEFALRYKC